MLTNVSLWTPAIYVYFACCRLYYFYPTLIYGEYLVNVHFSDIPHTFIPHYTLHSAEKSASDSPQITLDNFPHTEFRKLPLPCEVVIVFNLLFLGRPQTQPLYFYLFLKFIIAVFTVNNSLLFITAFSSHLQPWWFHSCLFETEKTGSAKDIRWRGRCRRRGRDSLNALEADDALRSSVLSLISAASAKNELFHYASTAQLLKYDKAIHLNKSTMQNGKPRKNRVFYPAIVN